MLTLKSREFFPIATKAHEDDLPLKARRDLGFIILVTVISGLVMAHFNFSETVLTWLRAHENFQLDEWPGSLLVLTSLLILYGLRRQRDLQRVIEAHRTAKDELSRQLKKNQALHLELFHVQEKERAHLAREVHDELGQYLSALRMDLHGLRSDCPDSAFIAHTEHSLMHMQDAVRHLLHELKPVALEELGLVPALENLVASWRLRLPDTDWTLELPNAEFTLDDTLAMTLFRITQEALTNIAKHSHAGHVDIRLRHTREEILLEINDDGLGSDLNAPMKGFGLAGMSERVHAINGQFDFSSELGQGFAIVVRLPVTETSL